MTLTLFSAIMAVVLFSIICTICSIILPKAKDRHLWIITLVFVLCVLRCLIPVEINGAITVNCWNLYPKIYSLLCRELFVGVTFGGLLCVIWGIGSLIFLIHLVSGLVYQNRLLKTNVCSAVNTHLNQLVVSTAATFSRSLTVKVYTTPDFAYPMMIGFFRPIVLLPESCASFSDEEISYILRHEIGHFLGGDLWIKLGIQLLVCLMWWNPAIYLLKRSADQLLELRCDRIACKSLTESERADYTSILLQVLHTDNFVKPKAVSAGFAGHSNKAFFKQRIRLLLSNVSTRTSRRLTVMTIVVCVLLYLGSYVFVFQPAALPPMDDEHQMVVISPENAYMVINDEGNYEVWVDGVLYATISKDTAQIEPFNELPLK